MNGAEVNQNHGSGGNWIAFVFGAVFNLLGNVNLAFLIDYALQAVVGGIICLAFKVLGDVLSPLWERHKEGEGLCQDEKDQRHQDRKEETP